MEEKELLKKIFEELYCNQKVSDETQNHLFEWYEKVSCPVPREIDKLLKLERKSKKIDFKLKKKKK